MYGYEDSFASGRTNWLRDADGNKKNLSPETEEEFQGLWVNLTELERYDITESNIAQVIYGRNLNGK